VVAVTLVAPESEGRTFADDETLLVTVLEEVIGAAEGEHALELHRRAVDLGRRFRGGEADAARELAELVGGLGTHDLELLVRSLTRWFQLVNLAEDNERVRRLHRRELSAAPTPRRGSLREAVVRLAADGTSAASCARPLPGPRCGS
jgi:phosphoenolpyruvate carboxylase